MPIFIAATRSFWFGMVPALLVILDLIVALSQDETLGPIAGMIEAFTGLSADTTERIMQGAGAVAALIIMHQRRGYNRPYTINPEKIK